ncbi:hypothetical protein COY25_00095 [Candidatus Uhrbacteria bacterium CG_4_10_14_0_2_um_filter_41_7]|uniref:Uncharacterized protein n=1 Tax=Candidatus Uhrbacteria bacterium CG_4_9_14_3_um_filter_41_35 TaxID=1975034 RepID=A0A2M7XGK6_9BACT|nr:MAG: hypothetical protein COY25_00095 [Candidatus Uhrbacteria bacterium CG_4_10_14_0_2_um_filter_41_7]PJA46866.1 MAG: hypothetical protein CO173_01430 [Candidatus Uhrbacteria bacterium CG_4_9_14_3_um_filter_41_35]
MQNFIERYRLPIIISLVILIFSFLLLLPFLKTNATSAIIIIRDHPSQVKTIAINRTGLKEDGNVNSITLTGGTTTTYYIIADLEDLNGVGEIGETDIVFYRSGLETGENCTSDPQNCYRLSTENNDCYFTPQSALGGTLLCKVRFEYWMDATVGSRSKYVDQNWQMKIALQNTINDQVVHGSYVNEVETLLQLALPEVIDYGELYPGESRTATEPAIIENIGNVDADLQVRFEDMVCDRGIIPVSAQRIDVTSGTYNEMEKSETSDALNIEAVKYRAVNLPQRTTKNRSFDEIYWSILVPNTGISGTCTSGGIITAI